MNEILTTTIRITTLVFLISCTSGIGMGLKWQQLVTPFKSAKLVVVAVTANFILTPLLAVGIARLLRLDEPIALGLLLLGLAAGAPFMPTVVGMAKGDQALAVGLMVLLMVGTTISLPVALPLLVTGVRVNTWEIARFLLQLMLAPLAAGLVVKAFAESAAAQLRPVLERVSNLALLVLVVLIVAVHFQGVLRIFGSGAILAAMLFTVLSSLTGWLLGGSNAALRTALGLGTGLRNIPAALIVGVQNFKDPNVPVMIVVTTLTGIFILLPAARMIGKRAIASH
ncbi:MAG: bile acid:sodium symporter [Verrucomicrobiota bacterium]